MPDRDLAQPRRVSVPTPSNPPDDRRAALPERPAGFPTEEQLAGADAEAAELRLQVEELRRRLDQPLPPVTPVARRSFRPDRRTVLGALVVGGTLGGVIATGVLAPWSTSAPSPVAPTNPFPSVAGPTLPASNAPAPLTAPAGALPATGPGVDRAGAVQAMSIEADGSVLVVEQAVLGPRGQRGLTLRLPSMTALGGDVAGLRPAVSDLRVAVNGTPVTARVDNQNGWTVDTGQTRARSVRLSYRLSGSLLRSDESRAGRSLVVTLPLLAQTLRDQGLPMTVRAAGTNVLGVTCPGAPAAEMLCGRQDPAGWTATVPPSATIPAVLLQVDLKS